MAKTCILFTCLCFILLRGDLNICGFETDGKLAGLCCSSIDVLHSRSSRLKAMEGQKDLGFHQKYLNLCSEDERRSYWFGTI